MGEGNQRPPHCIPIIDQRDSFAAYAASKAALNQALRHMAAELKRKDDKTVILALHPGEVSTYVYESQEMAMLTMDSDMGNIETDWDVEGIITPEESVTAMINVIESKGVQHSGTFWTWENKVSGCGL